MIAEILIKEDDRLKISWSDDKLGFGELNMKWDEGLRSYILDSELMTTDTIIKIIKCATADRKPKYLK